MKWLSAMVPFFGGMVVALNLVHLIETSPTYQASWVKVAVAVALSIGAPLAAEFAKKEGK